MLEEWHLSSVLMSLLRYGAPGIIWLQDRDARNFSLHASLEILTASEAADKKDALYRCMLVDRRGNKA